MHLFSSTAGNLLLYIIKFMKLIQFPCTNIRSLVSNFPCVNHTFILFESRKFGCHSIKFMSLIKEDSLPVYKHNKLYFYTSFVLIIWYNSLIPEQGICYHIMQLMNYEFNSHRIFSYIINIDDSELQCSFLCCHLY